MNVGRGSAAAMGVSADAHGAEIPETKARAARNGATRRGILTRRHLSKISALARDAVAAAVSDPEEARVSKNFLSDGQRRPPRRPLRRGAQQAASSRAEKTARARRG